MEFNNRVTTVEELREILGHPDPMVARKGRPRFDVFSRQFIEKSPFCLIASRNAAGDMDVSPKGDPPGFALVLDETTLVLPDRPGNRIADTLINILETPEVAVIFLVPAKGDTLRVNGRAQIVRDPDLLERMTHKGKVPKLAIVVSVETIFFHCAKCMIRSSLWSPEGWPDISALPSLGTVLKTQLEWDIELEKLDGLIDESYRDRLY
jgi:PPOX class probable FMN-dependent enzyme